MASMIAYRKLSHLYSDKKTLKRNNKKKYWNNSSTSNTAQPLWLKVRKVNTGLATCAYKYTHRITIIISLSKTKKMICKEVFLDNIPPNHLEQGQSPPPYNREMLKDNNVHSLAESIRGDSKGRQQKRYFFVNYSNNGIIICLHFCVRIITKAATMREMPSLRPPPKRKANTEW